MSAVTYDEHEPNWKAADSADSTTSPPPGRRRRRFFNKRSAALAAAITCAAGFYAGIAVEKGQRAASGDKVSTGWFSYALIASERYRARFEIFASTDVQLAGGAPGVILSLERGRLLASVPDLITVLDSETAGAIATERIAYGQRVTVIAFGCDPVWRTEEGIAVAGPRAFGYEFDYLPVEELAGATA